MTLEEVFAELEALKPAFSKEFDKSDIQYITNELAKRFDKLTKEQGQLPDCTKWESAEILISHAFNTDGILLQVTDKKVDDILKARGFDENNNKKVGDYIINACGFEDGVSFSVEKSGQFDLHKTHLLIKKEIWKNLVATRYELKFDMPEKADDGGIPSYYTKTLQYEKTPIRTLISQAQRKYVESKLTDKSNPHIQKLEELKTLLNDETIPNQVKKERVVELVRPYGLKFSLNELKRESFLHAVCAKMEDLVKSNIGPVELEKEADQKARANINLEYMWRYGGFKVYGHKKFMWQNINLPGQTSYDTVIANLKQMAPFFEKI